MTGRLGSIVIAMLTLATTVELLVARLTFLLLEDTSISWFYLIVVYPDGELWGFDNILMKICKIFYNFFRDSRLVE